VQTFRVCATIVKQGVAAGLSLFDLGQMVSRKVVGEPSPLEIACERSEREVLESVKSLDVEPTSFTDEEQMMHAALAGARIDQPVVEGSSLEDDEEIDLFALTLLLIQRLILMLQMLDQDAQRSALEGFEGLASLFDLNLIDSTTPTEQSNRSRGLSDCSPSAVLFYQVFEMRVAPAVIEQQLVQSTIECNCEQN